MGWKRILVSGYVSHNVSQQGHTQEAGFAHSCRGFAVGVGWGEWSWGDLCSPAGEQKEIILMLSNVLPLPPSSCVSTPSLQLGATHTHRLWTRLHRHPVVCIPILASSQSRLTTTVN